jgi:hypothetical protein
MVNSALIVIGVLTLTAISTGLYYSKNLIEEDLFKDRRLLSKGTNNKTLWLYYDQSDVNARWWADFGARSSRVLNTPYLNLCYNSIVKKNGTTYNVKVLAGLTDVAILLGGWNKLPKPLQNPIAPVNTAEINYLRARILREFGGLWVNPSTICIRPLPDFTKSNAVILFGTDKDETYSDENGTPAPGTDIMYSPEPNHPVFVELEQLALGRIEKQEGGRQFRGDVKWDLRTLMAKDNTIQYYPEYEFARKNSGRRIQLEDLLTSNSIPLNDRACYVPIDMKELEERRNFGWFLRMSEPQILESDLFISKLFKIHNVNAT